MKKLLLIIITCLFIGCSTKEDYMVKSIRQHWEDGAFKENKKIVTLDIKNPRYEMISEKQLQSTVLYHSYQQLELGTSLLENLNNMIRINQSQRRLYASIGMTELAINSHEEAGETLDDAEKLARAITNLSEYLKKEGGKVAKMDSLDKRYYEVTVDVRATVDTINTLDSLTYIMDKQYKIIVLSDLIKKLDYKSK